jgi:hypothetical protein
MYFSARITLQIRHIRLKFGWNSFNIMSSGNENKLTVAPYYCIYFKTEDELLLKKFNFFR